MTLWTRSFAQPWMLWLLLALPALALLLLWARWRRRRALVLLGTPYLVGRLTEIGSRRRRGQATLLLLGLFALILGGAGPRWGAGSPPERLGGKDIVVVLDLSRSMLAEQPSRLERARRALHDFADSLEARGGHRVALVAFAAHAKLLFPLTGDYDHFRYVLEQLDADHLPPALRPQVGEKIASGTRLGEALRLATASHDPERATRQDIVLLSDGDDPVYDDEWLQGVQAARKQAIPVHVVAVGDPREAHPIPTGKDLLRHDGAIVQSRLNESLLREIARRTGGIYVPAHTSALPLGRLMRGYLETQRDTTSADAQDKEPALEAVARPAWFLFSALLLLGTTMLVGDGARKKLARNGARTARLAVVALAAILVSAEPLGSVEELVRQGNAAFARQQFEEALKCYAKAEATSADPGLVAFNEGAALFRLGRFDEAALHYQRCLEDQAIPRERLARASYDLGTALVHARPDEQRRLEQAMDALRRCLDAGPSADLHEDALHNLELARWLWLKATPAPSPDRSNSAQGEAERPESKNARTQQAEGPMSKPGGVGTDEGDGAKNGMSEPGLEAKQKKLGHGPLEVLPDDSKLVPLSAGATAGHLEQLVERLRRERHTAWQLAPSVPDVKDW